MKRVPLCFVVLGFGVLVAVVPALWVEPSPAPTPAPTPPRPASPRPRVSPAANLRDELADLARRFASVRERPGTPASPQGFVEARRRLAERGSDLVPALVSLLHDDPTTGVPMMAVSLLGAIDGPEALDALDRARAEAALDEALRLSAVDAILAREDPGAETVLLRILQEGPGREQAASELGRRRCAGAVGPLARALDDERALSLACHAALALGEIGGPEAVGALRRAPSSPRHPALQRSIDQALSFLKESR
jgi:hypothetical protein